MRLSSHRVLSLAAATLALLPVCGCRSNMGPKMPPAMGAPGVTEYKADDFKKDVAQYRCLVSGTCVDSNGHAIPLDLSAARALRNGIAYHVMVDIEADYSKFEMKLTSGRAIQATLADATSLGLTAATTVVGASDVKDILAATGTAFQGSWTSYDKNFFQQKTTEAIVAQMRATRKNKQAQIISSLANRDVASYPWDAVWVDLIDFYYAGTVPSALVEIASSSGQEAKAAEINLQSVVSQQSLMAINAHAIYMKLQAELADPQKAPAATNALRAILSSAQYQPAANATAADLLALFKKAIADTDPDADPKGEKLKVLNAAIAAANVN